eukprot:s1343_g14.t1
MWVKTHRQDLEVEADPRNSQAVPHLRAGHPKSLVVRILRLNRKGPSVRRSREFDRENAVPTFGVVRALHPKALLEGRPDLCCMGLLPLAEVLSGSLAVLVVSGKLQALQPCTTKRTEQVLPMATFSTKA